MMTVRELIKKLSQYDDDVLDLPVCLVDWQGSYFELFELRGDEINVIDSKYSLENLQDASGLILLLGEE